MKALKTTFKTTVASDQSSFQLFKIEKVKSVLLIHKVQID